MPVDQLNGVKTATRTLEKRGLRVTYAPSYNCDTMIPWYYGEFIGMLGAGFIFGTLFQAWMDLRYIRKHGGVVHKYESQDSSSQQ